MAHQTLELILNEKMKLIDKKEARCTDKSCPVYGTLVRCYLADYYESCSKFMGEYKRKR